LHIFKKILRKKERGAQLYKDKILIFVHIPKTGGTSLANIIYKQYKPGDVLLVEDTSGNSIDQVTPNIKCILGHNVFGKYNHLGPCIHVTMLRNPVDRVISHYYYAKNVMKENNVARYSLEEFAQLSWVANLQTQFIAGGSPNIEQAISNLKSFGFFGITEMFSESLLLMEKTFKWKSIQYLRENVNEKKPKNETISKTTIKKIEEANSLDIQLYKWAKKEFESRIRNIK
jgi:hypothetical protein